MSVEFTVPMYRRLEVLRPRVNIETLRDGRGGVVTWVPPDEIVELDLSFAST